ncbi:GNAT family N-acetyltransferase [Streptococcus rifensis]
MLDIRTIRLEDESAYREFQRLLQEENNPFVEVNEVDNFKEFVAKSQLLETKGLSDAMSRMSRYYAFEGNRLVGEVECFWDADKPIIQQLGQVGYKVLKDYRRQGVAHQLLVYAKNAFIQKKQKEVLVTVKEDNLVGRRFIEQEGGVFEGFSSVTYFEESITVARYWLRTGEKVCSTSERFD